jgi:hypothetical protein
MTALKNDKLHIQSFTGSYQAFHKSVKWLLLGQKEKNLE